MLKIKVKKKVITIPHKNVTKSLISFKITKIKRVRNNKRNKNTGVKRKPNIAEIPNMCKNEKYSSNKLSPPKLLIKIKAKNSIKIELIYIMWVKAYFFRAK